MSTVELEASRAAIEGDRLRCVIVQGSLPNIRQFEVTREGNDVNSLRRWLTVADAAAVPDPKDEISAVVKDSQKRLEEMRVHAAYPSNGQGRASPRSTSQSPTAHRVQFSVPSRSPSASLEKYGRDRSGSADRGWRDDGGDKSGCRAAVELSHTKWITGVQIRRLSAVLAFLTCVIAAGITRVNVRRTHRGIVAVAAVAQASAQISLIRTGVRGVETFVVMELSRSAGRGSGSRTTRPMNSRLVSRTVHQLLVNVVEVGDLFLLMIDRQPMQIVTTVVVEAT